MATLRIGIHDKPGALSGLPANRIGIVAEHHNHRVAKAAEHPDQPSDKSLAAIFEQRLGASHASRSPGCEDNPGNHFKSARRFS